MTDDPGFDFQLAADVADGNGLCSRTGIAAVMREGSSRRLGSRGAVTTDTGAKVRAVFVICQVAISIVLLVAAGLLIRSFHALTKSADGHVDATASDDGVPAAAE